MEKNGFFRGKSIFYHPTPYGGPTEIKMEKNGFSSKKAIFFIQPSPFRKSIFEIYSFLNPFLKAIFPNTAEKIHSSSIFPRNSHSLHKGVI